MASDASSSRIRWKFRQKCTLLSLGVKHHLVSVHFDAVGTDAEFGVVEGLAGFDVEFPLVPGAWQDRRAN